MNNINKINWEEVARRLLQNERSTSRYNTPKPTGVLVSWKEEIYIGSIQEIASDYSREIVLLSKTSKPLNKKLVEAIRKLDLNRLELIAEDSLDLEGRQHALRRVRNKLTIMTPEQTNYMVTHLPQVYEL